MNITDLQKELDRCAKCGQCRSVCPVFLALKDETLVARGRLAIIQARSVALSLRGSPTGTTEAISNQTGLPRSSDVTSDSLAMTQEADVSPLYTKILNTCLMCRRCEENCPSLVETGKVFKSERQRIAQEKGLPLLLRLGFRWVLPNRWLYDSVMRIASWVMCLRPKTPNAPRSTLGVYTERSECAQRPLRHLPLYFANLFQRMPRLASKSALQVRHSSLGISHSPTVSIFVGCVANYIYPEIIEALVSILERLKIPYVIPQTQVCCGMPALLSGDEQSAQCLMKMNQEAFKTETIITVCPTCNRMLTEEYALKGVKVLDAVEFLNEASNLVLRPSSLGIRSAYHTPCHSAGTKAPEIIKAFLKTNTDYQEIDDICCGGGGLFTFKYPELSDLIGKVRMDGIEHIAKSIEGKDSTLGVYTERSECASRSTLNVVTNCPGCLMQLEYLLLGNPDIRVRHALNLIADVNGAHKTGQPVPHTHK
ncbi:MAG TPA: (Fe-S)-binding protein [Planctomycetota bacterium]|nr:(Fe-S)-binding protein [Planctomycetota bacterium]